MLAKWFIIFLSHSWKILLHPFLDLLKNKTQMVSTTVFINCRIFKYGIEKNIFLSPIWSKNLQKTKKIIKSFFDFFFPIKILCIGFWEHSTAGDSFPDLIKIGLYHYKTTLYFITTHRHIHRQTAFIDRSLSLVHIVACNTLKRMVH